MPMLAAIIPGGFDLLFILVIALSLFGNRLPMLIRGCEQAGVRSRCRHCGRPSFSELRCPHRGRLKYSRMTFGFSNMLLQRVYSTG
jgi:hypothetical protein